ncbi:MAG: aminoacyl-tRNA hydrolase [Sphingomonadales bacterium]|nr:aminoacyl-tRNA hydrolase [Sphingomonadales bacterium]
MSTLYTLPDEALEERFLAGTGPGGQNVNKVATACQLRVDVAALGLPADAERRLKALAGSRLTLDGAIILLARNYRTREANREDARTRLLDMIEAALKRPVYRVKTKPSRAAQARRADSKTQRGTVKKMRGKVRLD